MAEGEPRRSQTFVTAFARGLSLIEAFGPETRRMTVAEAAQRIDLDRAVTRRLLRTLVDLGYATATGRQFELTSKTLKLGYSERKRLSVELKLSSGPVGIGRHKPRSETRRVEEGSEASAVRQG